ncbi:MAG: hypothetical protein WBL20_06270 [Sphingobium sp.]|uniref:hypothetical protein n=1 Tax=Sphingobium sp. TaxID=1912891 RepID=UPI002E2394E3
MSRTIERRFATRTEAENAIELLVQQHGIERSDIFVAADGPDNSVGKEISGGDAAAPLEEERDDAALHSPVLVSIDVNDETKVGLVERALAEAGAD